MGRTRLNNDLRLPKRVYVRRGKFYYAHPGGAWEPLGSDIEVARQKGNHYNDPTGQHGTMRWFLDQFLIYFEELVQSGEKSPRTLKDYRANLVPLKLYFGDMTPERVRPEDVTRYLHAGKATNRAVRANREKACLSACFSYLIGHGLIPKQDNPCFKQFGVKRNREKPRDRYVTDAEMAAVKLVAGKSVAGMMDLVYATLQRPTDVIRWSGQDIAENGSQRVLRVYQHKTGKRLDIAITGDLAAALLRSGGHGGQTFIHTTKGKQYTDDGLSSMLRRYCKKAGVQSFGFRDLKAKGATDMYQAGESLERIQHLCGHKSVKTTEIYVKRHLQEVVQPHTRKAK